MNLLDFPLNEPVQFERLTYINGLNGIEPGYAVLGDPIRLGLGRQSWFDLAEWLGARAIQCRLEGPFWSRWAMEQYEAGWADAYTLRIAYEAQALVRIERDEDVVRYERTLLRGFGRPAIRIQQQMVTQQEIRQWGPGLVGFVKQRMIEDLERKVGPLPGGHITQRLPVNPVYR